MGQIIVISIHPPLAGRDVGLLPMPEAKIISIHPPLAGRDKPPPRGRACGPDFNPPAPCGAGRRSASFSLRVSSISIHPPLAGRDLFLSPLPLSAKAFQSTRPLRGGTRPNEGMTPFVMISIHPPLAGRDRQLFWGPALQAISIHPPLAGRDSTPAAAASLPGLFQSTRPLRGGTRRPGAYPGPDVYFNPPAPCGAGQ